MGGASWGGSEGEQERKIGLYGTGPVPVLEAEATGAVYLEGSY